MSGRIRLPQRRSLRLQGYDYSQAGAYFVTACTAQRLCTLGKVAEDQVILSERGGIVAEAWASLPAHFTTVELDAFVVMPNHLHGILVLSGEEGGPTLGPVMGYYKYNTTKLVNAAIGMPGEPVWQRGYHDRVIRDENSLRHLREYIENNPLKWRLDTLNPDQRAVRPS